MRMLGLVDTVIAAAKSGKPFLGICLGLQLMFEESEEAPGIRGLGIFKGKVVKIPDAPQLKIPHMGWKNTETVKESKILSGNPYVYFVHSYYIEPDDKNIISAYTEYGKKIAVARRGRKCIRHSIPPRKKRSGGT